MLIINAVEEIDEKPYGGGGGIHPLVLYVRGLSNDDGDAKENVD